MKPRNKTIKTFSKIHSIIFLLLAGIIFTACKDYTDDDEIYYYDVYGEGYVYYRDTNLSVKGLEIVLRTSVNSGFAWGSIAPNDTFYTDSKGYYRLRFMRYIYGYDPNNYYISDFGGEYIEFFYNDCYWLTEGGPDKIIPVEMIDNAKHNIQFDTIKIYKE